MKNNQLKIFLIELLFFSATLLLGIAVAVNIEELIQAAHAENGGNEELISALSFLVYFVIATGLVFLVSKSEKLKKKRLLFFRVAFLFSVAFGSLITLSVFLGELISLFLIIILLLLWKRKPVIILHNLLIVFSIAGIGAVMGAMLDTLAIVFFLVLFSIYDVIAVYKTKHMVKMATEMIKTKAILGLIIPSSFGGLFDNLEKKKKKEFMVLGGGDLAFPLFLVASVAISYGINQALAVAFFSTMGLFFSFFFFITQKEKKPIPALPPIALFSILGYLITTLFIG